MRCSHDGETTVGRNRHGCARRGMFGQRRRDAARRHRDGSGARGDRTGGQSDDRAARRSRRAARRPHPTSRNTGAVPIDEEIEPEIRPGVEQISLIGATPGADFVLVAGDEFDVPVSSGTADAYGSLVFRSLDAATDYRVGDEAVLTAPIDVLARDEHPDPAFYAEQRLTVVRTETTGFDYIETRDGTTLGAYIVLPGPVQDGPYPTVVEYSGYSPSNPEQGAGFATLFQSLGYAYVGVNMRGTGCSGGSFRFFEYAQSTDGYDVIETVAAQPWVAGNAVGMVGISYPGISQLFVAQTQPPSLRGDHPAVGQRRQLPGHPLPGRHPQHRLRGELDPGTRRLGDAVDRPRWSANRSRTGLDRRPDRDGRRRVRRESGGPAPESGPRRRDPSATSSTTPSSVTTSPRAVSSTGSRSRRFSQERGRTSRRGTGSRRCSTSSPGPIGSTRRSSTDCTPSRSGPAVLPRMLEFLEPLRRGAHTRPGAGARRGTDPGCGDLGNRRGRRDPRPVRRPRLLRRSCGVRGRADRSRCCSSREPPTVRLLGAPGPVQRTLRRVADPLGRVDDLAPRAPAR